MTIKHFKIKALAIFAIFMMGLGWAGLGNISDVQAEETKSVMFISPMIQKIILNPGETYTGTVAVSNNSGATEDLEYTAKVGSYTPVGSADGKDDYGGADVDKVTNYNSMMEWMTLDKDGGKVAPNNQELITYTIKVPKTAPAGAQYASILVSKKDTDDSNVKGSAIKTKYQLASVIYANVAGETVEKGSIKENNLPTILTNNKLEATSMVRNDGNIYTDASYTLQVWPLFSDEEICTNEESVETSMILPNTERYHVQTCDLPPVGVFRAKQVVSIFGEESVLEKTIIVCPIWLMVVIIAIIIAIIVAIIFAIKKHKKSVDEE